MGGRRRRGLEWLETRCLLSGIPSPPSITLGNIVSVLPTNGAQLTSPPENLVVTINLPINFAVMGNFDLELEKVNRDGTMTPVWSDTAPPELADATGTEIIIPAKKFDPSDGLFDGSLAPGTYEVFLTPNTVLSVYASGLFGPGARLPGSG